MKVRVICRPDQLDWILGKIATRLIDELDSLIDVSLGAEPSPTADINHYVWYDDFRDTSSPATIGITHIDSVRKFDMIQDQLKHALAGICMSRTHMEDLFHAGIRGDRLCYVTPAHDGAMLPKKIHIGITTRLYTPDPCKREWLLLQLADRISALDFSFSIMGNGWDEIVERLRSRGFLVTHFADFDLEQYRTIVPTFDYYLYFGWDEGSMGFLDALHAGVRTIVTPQGFHLDVPGGITHGFTDIDTLNAIFAEISRENRERRDSVRELTWSRYAEKHFQLWRYLLSESNSVELGTSRDGLNSLLDPKPSRDSVRGKAFMTELERIDQQRDQMQSDFDAMQRADIQGLDG